VILSSQKSKIGLGDLYEAQYASEVLREGQPREESKELQKIREELRQKFSKLCYLLDTLSNSVFTPRPPVVWKNLENKNSNGLATLTVEEAVPILVSSVVSGERAPQELKKVEKLTETNEMKKSEKSAVRNLNKHRRSQKLKKRVESGELTLENVRQRQAKLQEKNKLAKIAQNERKNIPLNSKKTTKITANALMLKASQRGAGQTGGVENQTVKKAGLKRAVPPSGEDAKVAAKVNAKKLKL
jgi:U3 small nucleolar ribonucleoprotein component